MSTTTVSRAATAGLVGGVLYALFPLTWHVGNVEDLEYGTLGFVAVLVSYWIVAVVAPALIVVGLTGLRRALGTDAGRVGTVGLVGSMIGLAAMGLGVGIELASVSFGGGEVALGHFTLLVGFLIHVAASILLGIVIFRRRRDGLSRAAGLLLVLAFPLGIGLGLLGSSIDPENDAWFWAAITVPTGIAWVLLGSSLRSVREPAPASEYVPAA
jgi:hypothetical protein